MASSKCPHCQNSTFELKVAEPHNAQFKMHFVQCAKCGAPFGQIDYENPAILLRQQNAVINALAAKLGVQADLPALS
jgi:NAD-dependent SIR2 family protein deacetylase